METISLHHNSRRVISVVMRNLSKKELREISPDILRLRSTEGGAAGLSEKQIEENRAWYAFADAYDESFVRYTAARDALELGQHVSGPLPVRPRPFWGRGPRPALPPFPPTLTTDAPPPGRPVGQEPLFPVPLRLPLRALNRINAERGNVSIAQYVQTLVLSVIDP